MNKIIEKLDVDEVAERIRPLLKDIHPHLGVYTERRKVKPTQGGSYFAWVLLFRCRDIQFSMEPTDDIEAIRRVFLKEQQLHLADKH